MSCHIAPVQQSSYATCTCTAWLLLHLTHNTRYVSMFEPSGVRLRLTAGCTDTCISQRSFQQAFGADCGKDEGPKFERVLLEAVRVGPYSESPSAAAYPNLRSIQWN